MVNLQKILEEMASELEEVLALSLTDLNGLTVVEHNPTGINIDGFSARFASVIKMIEKSITELESWGEFKENLSLIQTSHAWILIHLLKNQFFLTIAVTRRGNLRNLREVTRKYESKLRDAL